MRFFGMALAVWLATAGLASAADLTLKDPTGQARTLSDAQLKALPHIRAVMDDHGTAVSYEGVLIDDILPLVGWSKAEPIRGPAFAKVMIFTASDGYVVVLPLSQVDGDFATGAVAVADGKDGKPLAASEGPFRLIVQGDKRPARSVRNLTGIELRDLR